MILNQELFRGVRQSHGDITLRMLNKLSNAETANQLPAALVPSMRQILYGGYRNIVIAALALIVAALLIVFPLALRSHPEKTH